jgi:hypothetical protein
LQGLHANAARFLLALFARCEGSPFVDEFSREPSLLIIVCLCTSGGQGVEFFSLGVNPPMGRDNPRTTGVPHFLNVMIGDVFSVGSHLMPK